MKKSKLLIVSFSIALLLIAMTFSDIYYSNLNKEYPLLSNLESFEGKVTDLKIHFGYTYIELDSQKRALIRPSNLKNEPKEKFHQLVKEGDFILFSDSRNEFTLKQMDKDFRFIIKN
jgi:3-isopropylmalate dehydratase small subunit